jgi:hypothetical protein
MALSSELYHFSRVSTVSLATRLRAELPEFDSRQGAAIFFFATASRPALEPTQPPIQIVPRGGGLLQVKGPECEAATPLTSN